MRMALTLLDTANISAVEGEIQSALKANNFTVEIDGEKIVIQLQINVYQS